MWSRNLRVRGWAGLIGIVMLWAGLPSPAVAGSGEEGFKTLRLPGGGDLRIRQGAPQRRPGRAFGTGNPAQPARRHSGISPGMVTAMATADATGAAFSITSYDAGEGDAVDVMVVLTRDATNGSAYTVRYGTSGTATPGEDYLDSGTGTLAWGAGESGVRTIPLRILEDSSPEEEETVILDLFGAVGGVVGSPSRAVVLINDAADGDPADAVSAVSSENQVLQVNRED